MVIVPQMIQMVILMFKTKQMLNVMNDKGTKLNTLLLTLFLKIWESSSYSQ